MIDISTVSSLLWKAGGFFDAGYDGDGGGGSLTVTPPFTFQGVV
jgi:hypothetical protein